MRVKKMNNAAYVIPTRRIYVEFRTRLNCMSCIDIDEDEIFKLLIESLANTTWGHVFDKPAWADFAESYRCYGGWSGEPTTDGEILSGAIENFQKGLLELLMTLGFVTAFGLLPFRYERMLAGDMVLVDISKVD